MVDMLRTSGLARDARIVVEKPFGSDLASARELNDALHEAASEDQIFRIDHFLGKEAAQNVLAFRFANRLFEPVWNRDHISHVQIDVPETLTVDGRGGFYEETGAFRDMVVTHLAQLLGFVAMEPPARLDARALRDEKAKVFDAIAPFDPSRAIFGQYDGYRDAEGVEDDSTTETFVALEVRVRNWRWSDVPFFLRTGKALAEGRRRIVVAFREAPLEVFPLADGALAGPNEVAFELSDDPHISVGLLAKQPGGTLSLAPASLQLDFSDAFDVSKGLEAYERLLHDVMLGDHTLFTRADEVERLWEVADLILRAPPPPLPYGVGSWGPDASRSIAEPWGWALPQSDQG